MAGTFEPQIEYYDKAWKKLVDSRVLRPGEAGEYSHTLRRVCAPAPDKRRLGEKGRGADRQRGSERDRENREWTQQSLSARADVESSHGHLQRGRCKSHVEIERIKYVARQ